LKHSVYCLLFICVDALRRNPVTCRATDADVAAVVKEWLKHARDRDGGRARRAEVRAGVDLASTPRSPPRDQ